MLPSYIKNADDPRVITTTTACATAIVSWLFLHSHSVRGDRALVTYLLAAPNLYFVIAHLVPKSSMALTTLFIVSYASTILFITAAYRLSPIHPLAKYPGPKLWWISNVSLLKLSLTGRRHQILDKLHATYGPVVRIGHDTISINSRSCLAPLYGATTSIEKSDAYRLPGHKDVVCLFYKQNKAAHSERKKIWTAALTTSSVKNYMPYMESRASELFDCIQDRQRTNGGSVNLGQCFSDWSYDLMADIMYGGCNDNAMMQKGDVKDLVACGKQAMVALDSFGQIPWLMDIIWYIPSGEAMVKYSRAAAAMMHNRIKTNDSITSRDISSYLLESMKSGKTIPVRDLEVEAVNVLFGGGDSISGAATTIFAYLLAYPKYYSMLYSELVTKFPNPRQNLDTAALAEIPLLNGVIEEALRIQTGFYFPRVIPAGGVAIDGNFFPEGTIVSVAPYSQQTSPENFYPEPLEFRPERWLPKGLGENTICDRTAQLAFSTGQHVCVGRSFAYSQLRYVISRIILSYEMSFASGFDARAFFDGIRHIRTVLLTSPLLVIVKKRSEIPAHI